MGQYLAVGISTKISISIEEVEKQKITLEETLQKMQQSFHFAPDIYDFAEEKGVWKWVLKKEIWEGELFNFLKVFYPLVYTNKKDSDYIDVLEKFSQTQANTWLELAVEKSFEAFQMDNYGEDERMYFDEKAFKPKLIVSFTTVALTMEGKIIMETYGRLFNFFKYCVQNNFKEFQISKAIRVYITG